MGMFDPASFMDQSFEGANDTKFEPVPAGEYPGEIEVGSLEVKEWASRDQTKSGLKLQMRIVLNDPTLSEKLGRDKVSIRHDVMLDVTPSGGLDFGKGKNIRLGQLREAAGLNKPGVSFSFKQLEGRQLKVKVGQRVADDQVYDEVKGVAPL